VPRSVEHRTTQGLRRELLHASGNVIPTCERQNPKADDGGSAETPTSALVRLLSNRIAEENDDEDGHKLFC
jgi:hypothetical protein